MTPKFSLVIRWSDEDQCYIAWAAEFGSGVKTQGSTYEEAAQKGHQLIESMIDWHEEAHLPLPEAWLFSDPELDDRTGRQLFADNPAYKAPVATARAAQVKHATT